MEGEPEENKAKYAPGDEEKEGFLGYGCLGYKIGKQKVSPKEDHEDHTGYSHPPAFKIFRF